MRIDKSPVNLREVKAVGEMTQGLQGARKYHYWRDGQKVGAYLEKEKEKSQRLGTNQGRHSSWVWTLVRICESINNDNDNEDDNN